MGFYPSAAIPSCAGGGRIYCCSSPDLLLHQAFQPGHKSGAVASPSRAGELRAASCSLFHVCLSASPRLTFPFFGMCPCLSAACLALEGGG